MIFSAYEMLSTLTVIKFCSYVPVQAPPLSYFHIYSLDQQRGMKSTSSCLRAFPLKCNSQQRDVITKQCRDVFGHKGGALYVN